MRVLSLAFCAFLLLGLSQTSFAQRAASPRGEASTQVGADFDKWIVVDYGRPILRGRTNMFGEGDTYGQAIYAGAPVWRAGANVTTTLMTETDLEIGGTRLPAGQYTMFVGLAEGAWTLILSNHKAKANYRSEEEGLWGAYSYTPDKDVLRASMNVSEHPVSFDQFTISFADVTASGGQLALIWGHTMATVEFSAAN